MHVSMQQHTNEMLSSCKYYILIVLAYTSISHAWSPDSFFLNSKLPKLCGHVRSYSPESTFTPRGTWPWLGMLTYNGNVRCSCVLIHAQVAITSSLCISTKSGVASSDDMVVSFSTPGLPSGQTASISHIRFTNDDDGKGVALLRFVRPLEISQYVQPICLWEENHDYTTQLMSNYGLMIGTDLAGNFQLNGMRIFQIPIQIIGNGRCNSRDKSFLCILHYKETQSCHFIGSSLMFPRLSEDGSIVWFLRGLQTKRLSSCVAGDANQIFDIATQRPWIESHFKPSVTVGCGRRKVSFTELVYFGTEATRGDYPWHIGLFYKTDNSNIGSYRCGGSLISTTHVITAAHCVTARNQAFPPEKLSVILGKHDLSVSEPGAMIKPVIGILVHEGFSQNTLRNDIALLKLGSDVVFNEFIQPVCLWEETDIKKESIYNKVAKVPGWGFTENQSLSTILYTASMPIKTDLECYQSHDTFYKQFLTDKTLCAGNPKGNGPKVCNGDSGGGLVLPYVQEDKVVSWFLRGIVSVTVAKTDAKICDPDYYAVYTDVAQYGKWISTNVVKRF